MNNHNYEMATPITSLQSHNNPNVNNLVRNVENNIENLSNTQSVKESMNANINYQPFVHQDDKIQQHLQQPNQQTNQQTNQQYNQQHNQQHNQQQYQSYQSQTQPQHAEYNPILPSNIVQKEPSLQKEASRVVLKKSWRNRLLVNSKEYLIIILLFSLLAHKKINKLLMVTIPFIDTYESPMPSLILRGIILAILMFIIKYFV